MEQSFRKWAKGLFQLKLGPVKIKTEAIVVDIEDDGLLGVDVLQNASGGNSNLMLSKGVLLINKQDSTSRQRSGKGATRKRFPHQKPRWEKTKLTIRYLYHENIS